MEQIAFVGKDKTVFESNDLLSVLALRSLGKEKEAGEWVSLWKNGGGNLARDWCLSIYDRKEEEADSLLTKQVEQQEKTPWESIYVDRNFELLTKLKAWLLSE